MRYGFIIVLVVCTGAIVLYFVYFYNISYHGNVASEEFESFRHKDVSQWTQQQLEMFMTMKENIYSLRRQRIKQKCYRNPVRT